MPDTYSNDFRNWVRTIGSDEFCGRKPMTPYETKTIDYLAGEFRLLGLEPAFGDSYYQTVREISTTVRLPRNGIRVKTARGTVSLSTPEDLMIWTARRTDQVSFDDVEFVFCGFGIDAPECITYFLTPFVTVGTSILVYFLLERSMPKLTAMSMGNRYQFFKQPMGTMWIPSGRVYA